MTVWESQDVEVGTQNPESLNLGRRGQNGVGRGPFWRGAVTFLLTSTDLTEGVLCISTSRFMPKAWAQLAAQLWVITGSEARGRQKGVNGVGIGGQWFRLRMAGTGEAWEEGLAEEACRRDGDATSLLLARQGRPKELTTPG